MKKIIQIAILVIYNLAVYAQVEFAPIGAVWTDLSIHYMQVPPFTISRALNKSFSEKDTLIGGKIARKVIINSHFPADIDERYFYQENDKVYYYSRGQYKLFFDFAAAVGDTVYSYQEWGNNLPLLVVTITTDSIKNKAYKKFGVRSGCGIHHFDYDTFYIHQLFGALKFHSLLFTETRCAADIPIFSLKCYSDPKVGEINFDNIPCDSLRDITINIKEIKNPNQQFLITPNPAQDQITVYVNDYHNSNENYQLTFYNQNGQIALQKNFSGVKSTIDINTLHSGMYFYRIQNKLKIKQTGKIVVTE